MPVNARRGCGHTGHAAEEPRGDRVEQDADRTPVAMKPLYSAPMIDWLEPSRTKNVPMMEVSTQAPPMASG